MIDVSLGVLCDRHVGSDHPPRCADCDQATVDAAALVTRARLRGECPQHVGYPMDRFGCARCLREEMPDA